MIPAQAATPDASRVVIVDDDDLYRELLGLNLTEEGFNVVDFDNGEVALNFFDDGEKANAVLLDWRMPGLDGLGVLRGLRQRQIGTPVIFLTELGDETHEEVALKWGAVDFIDKSRRLSIILQRLKLFTESGKSAGPNGQAVICDGPLELRTRVKRAYWNGSQLDLTLTEFDIVYLLVSRLNSDITYREIYDQVRGEDFFAGAGPEGYRANVRSFIKRIRKKFRKAEPEFECIENYAGFGYRWASHPYSAFSDSSAELSGSAEGQMTLGSHAALPAERA